MGFRKLKTKRDKGIKNNLQKWLQKRPMNQRKCVPPHNNEKIINQTQAECCCISANDKW